MVNMSKLYALSHGIEGLLFLAAASFLYWRLKSREYDIRVTRLTMYVLALLGLFFEGIYLATGVLGNSLTAAVIPVVHLFVFGAIAYMWQFITAWSYSEYEKYHGVFWALGAISVLAGFGIFAGVIPPKVGQIIPLSLIPAGIAIGAIGFMTASEMGGADGQKIAIFTAAGIDALLVSSLLNNLFLAGVLPSPFPAIVNNLLYGGLFLLAVFWGHIKGVEW